MKKIKLNLKDNYRIIVISDIHGHLKEYKKLMSRLNLKKDDYLIILGDFVNKGYDSYGMLMEMRELSKRENTFILKGNHELNLQNIFSSFEKFNSIEDFMKNEYYETLFHSMIRSKNFEVDDFSSHEALYNFIKKEFTEDMNFISDLYTLAENDDFIFVHGGYKDDLGSEEKSYLKYDFYNDSSHVNEKIVVVGHWPTCNLRMDMISNEPFFNMDNKIISIDGGIGVKNTGELNAFIIEKNHGEISYDFIQQNNFSSKEISKAFEFKKEDLIYINYPHFDIRVLERKDGTTLCKHVFSGKEFTVFNCLLDESGEKPYTKICYINNFLNLKEKDKVSLVNTYGDYALVKHNREFGWIMKDQI